MAGSTNNTSVTLLNDNTEAEPLKDSKRFLVLLITAILIVVTNLLAQYLPLEVPPEVLQGVASEISGYLFGLAIVWVTARTVRKGK